MPCNTLVHQDIKIKDMQTSMDLGVDLLPDVLKALNLMPSTGVVGWGGGDTQGKTIDVPNSSSRVLFMVKKTDHVLLPFTNTLMDTRHRHIPSSVQGYNDWCLI